MIYLKIESDSISNISKRAQKAEVTSNLETEEECDISKYFRMRSMLQMMVCYFFYYFLLLIRIIY
jgi:hypothetical protein